MSVEREALDAVRVLASEIIHLFRPLRPGQIRGEPWLARALVNNPPLILGDEPTGNLDSRSSDEVVSLLRRATDDWGRSIVVDKRPAKGFVGVAVPATHSLPVALARKVPYDPIKDFTPLSIIANNPLAIVVTPDLPVNNLRELVEYARKNPGKLSYGTSGAGTAQHLVGEMLNQFSHINIVHVPYKGGSGALNDLLGGQIQVGYVVVPTVLQHVKAGKLKMLAVIDDRRYSELPDVPTNREALPGFEPKTSWLGIFGPPTCRLPSPRA